MPTAKDLRSLSVSFASQVAPLELTGTEAAEVAADLAAAGKAIAGALLRVGRKVACSDDWRDQGHASATDWLAALCGISVAEARAQLRMAKQIEDLSATAEAMANGELSPGQAAAIADAATADPEAEDELLESAKKDTFKNLKDKAAKKKAAATDSHTRSKKIHADRSVRMHTDAEGAFHLHLRGPAADGARLRSLLRPYEEQAFTPRPETVDGHRDTFDNRSYDAFFNLLADLQAAAENTNRDSSGVSVPGDARRPPKGGDNIKVIVRVDHAALVRGHTVAGETCDIVGLGAVPVADVRDLMRDAFIAAVVTKGRDVVNVAHLGRGCNAVQRTALEWAGLRCSNQACNRTIALQIDHREPWAAKQETKLDNQDPLCPECHRRKTHHGWTLDPGTGPRRFRPPPEDPSPRPPAARASAPRTDGNDRRSGGARSPAENQPSLC